MEVAAQHPLKLNELTIRGFRALNNVSLPLSDLMVLIGANGAGKTTFLDVFKLLHSAVSERLREAISERAGIQSILSKFGAEVIEFCVSAKDDERSPLRYEVSLTPSGASYVLQEELYEHQHGPSNPPFKFVTGRGNQRLIRDPRTPDGFVKASVTDELELILPQLPRVYPRVESFRTLLRTIVYYAPIEIGRRSPVRLPQQLEPGMTPDADGGRLFSALYNIRAQEPEAYEHILSVIQAGFPTFEKLEFPVVASGQVELLWFDTHGRKYDQRQLSDGSLRFLWLVTVLMSPTRPRVILIDEPELSLHPELLMILSEVMKECALQSQVIVATHADRLVRWLDPADVVTVDTGENGAVLKRLDSERLRVWLQDYSLDELWHMGELGARP